MKWFKNLCIFAAIFTCLLPLRALSADIIPPVTTANQVGQKYPSSLTVALQCVDSAGSGCAGTFYCLGNGCEPSVPYQGQKISIIESNSLRFYSVDYSSNTEAVKTEVYTIIFPDKVPPVVNDFIVPSTYRNFTIPVIVNATDNVAVAGYCLTETNDSNTCTWSNDRPNSYVFGGPGPHTLYAYAMDSGGNVSEPLSAHVTEEPNFVRVPQAVDMVYGAKQDILYITSGSSILRYKLASRTFLAPYQTSGNLSGIDLSPDGNTLVAADESHSSIYLANLNTNTISEKTFTPSTGETGNHSVAFGADGSVLVASKSSDSSSTPLRRYDPVSGDIKVIANLTGATVVSSPSASCIAVRENKYYGLFGTYDVATQQINKSTIPDSSGTEIGVSRDCEQLADTAAIYTNKELVRNIRLDTIVGVAYHPNADTIYLANSYSSNVSAYETKKFSTIAAYDAGNIFTSGTGHLKVSPDGSRLFARVDQGISIVKLSAPAAQSQSVLVNQGTPTPIHLKASSPLNDPLTFQIVAMPKHGTLAGTTPDLTYTSDLNYVGSDSLSFKVSNSHGEEGQATVAITVVLDAIPPIITSFSILSLSSSFVVPITAFTATDNIGVTGYCLIETNTSDGCTWTSTPPTSYDFSKTSQSFRPRTLLAFVRDAAGNISQSVASTVAITATGAVPSAPVVSVPSVISNFWAGITLLSTSTTDIQYCVTETNDPLQCTSWNTYVGGYTFQSYGTHTLYIYAINATGNISAPTSATVSVIGQGGIQVPGSFKRISYDSTRKILYLLQPSKVLRYHMPSQTYLSPYLDGKSLAGMDISPDGNTLVVGNATEVGIHVIDIQTEIAKTVNFTPVQNEPKTTGVAFGSDGAVIVVGGGSSGSAPMRRFDPATGDVKVVAMIPTGWFSDLSPSPGGKCISLYDFSGNVNVYDTGSQTITYTNYNIWKSSFPNRDCSQFAMPTPGTYSYYNTYLNIYNGTLTNVIKTLPAPSWDSRVLGVYYHPSKDIAYVLNGTNVVTAYETSTFTPLASYQMNGVLDTGWGYVMSVQMLVSPDGSTLFVLYPDGVDSTQLSGVVAEEQNLSIVGANPTGVTLTGRSSRTSTVTYRIVAPPIHGTLTGIAPHLIYTPDADFLGKDSFTYSVNDGTEESAPASITIAIGSGQPIPLWVHLEGSGSSQTSFMDVSINISVYSGSTIGKITGPLSWCLTENSSAASCSWSSTKPLQYTFSGDFPQGVPVPRSLYAFVMDGTGRIYESYPASFLITRPDTTPPVLLGFSVPATYPGLEIPFALVAGDNVSVPFYCVTETNSSSGCSWQWINGNHLLKRTVSSYGLHTLYAFVYDGRNVSTSATASVFAVDPPRFTNIPTPSFVIGKNATFTIASSGFPIPTLSISGSLPAGVLFTPKADGTASLSGAPAPGTAGEYVVTVTADIGMGYIVTRDLTVTVVKDKQFLDFEPIASKIITDPPFNLSVIASSGLPVTLRSSNPAVATVVGSTVTIHSVGYTEITAQQAGDGRYEPVSKTHILNVGLKYFESVVKISALRDSDTTNYLVANLSGIVVNPDEIASLTINGAAVPFNSNGHFSTAILLAPYSNLIRIQALGKDDTTVTEVRSIVRYSSPSLLSVYQPADNAVVNTTGMVVQGYCGAKTVLISVNSGSATTVTVDSVGNFNFPVPLSDGLNTIYITAAYPEGTLLTEKRSIFVAQDGLSLEIANPPADSLFSNHYSHSDTGWTAISGYVDPQANITVNIDINGNTFTPTVYNGWFTQYIEFTKTGLYPISVTAIDGTGKSASSIRNIVYLTGVSDGILIPATGKIEPDISDALRVLRIVVGLVTPTLDDFSHGDVAPLNYGVPAPDGSIDLLDALVILRRVVGLVSW